MNKKIYAGIIILVSTVGSSISISQTTPALPYTSSSFIPPTTNPNAILTTASGFIQDNPLSPNYRLSFDTNVACPTNFSPYVTLTASTLGNAANTGANSFKTCVTSATQANNNVHVNIYTLQSIFTYQDTTITSGYYSSRSWVMVGQSMPSTSWIQPVTTTSEGITGLSWVLYCYPASIPVPAVACP